MIDQRLPIVTIDGVALHAIDEATCVRHVLDELAAGRGGWIVTPNLDHLCRASRDQDFRRMLGKADLALADGMPLLWATKVQGTPLPQRVAGSTLVWTLAEAAAGQGRSLFLLGGAPGSAQAAARVLHQRFPDLKIAGTHCPPMGFENDQAQMRAITEALVAAKPDLVYVGLGSPKQERLIEQLRLQNLLPAAWFLGVGISISFIAGHVKRAPKLLQVIGLEWFHRLCQEPRRLARRYLLDDFPYLFRVLWLAGRHRLAGKDCGNETGKDGRKRDTRDCH
ncbi:MAG: WecB/TagA/CpsF family glycosyltransferase [Phycisphaeraceae bacterium]|nr:WecB/TagA/CpsF family glycosyltransferase [Phycisphaeraceae bacterium]